MNSDITFQDETVVQKPKDDMFSFYRINDFERYFDPYASVDEEGRDLEEETRGKEDDGHASLLFKENASRSDTFESAKYPRSVYDFATIRPAEAVILFDEEVAAQSEPHTLLPNHFSTQFPLSQIVSIITTTFSQSFPEIAFDYSHRECKFSCILAKSVTYCNFSIKIYQKVDGTNHTVEMQKMTKDSCGFTFTGIFGTMKARLISSRPEESLEIVDASNREWNNSLDIENDVQLVEHEINEHLLHAIHLCYSENRRERECGSRLLCEMSHHPQMCSQLATRAPVVAMKDCLCSVSIDSRICQYTVFALGQISSNDSHIPLLLETGIVPVILPLARKGTYHNLSVRRECARVLYLLATADVNLFTASVEKEVLQTWLHSIPEIEDSDMQNKCNQTASLLNAVAEAQEMIIS